VSEENVVRFDPSPRTGMARRGAPDKAQAPPPKTVEVECPNCDAVTSLEAGILTLDPEVLCAGCDTTIPLEEGGRWKVVGGRDEREP
jgi:ribosomal protein S27E